MNQEAIDNSSQWHLDKRVNIGHILTTAALLIGAITYAYGIDKRVTVVEVQTQINTQNQQVVNQQVTDQLKSINNKLDRLIERVSEH